MDNVSFHGTNRKSASIIIGPPPKVDVTIGKGELGKGFYTGSSIALAAIWAQIKYESEAVVIEFDIPRPRFIRLKGHIIKTKGEVKKTWKMLIAGNQTSKFSFGFDYIISPFATIEQTGHQYKFESQNAEDELNAAHKSIYPCVS